jgi:PAS domain S-box-containing protein
LQADFRAFAGADPLPSESAMATPPTPASLPGVRRYTAARIAGAYLLFGLIWIWLSDRTLLLLGVQGEYGFWVATAKGTVFICLSAGLVFWLARRELAAAARSANLLRAVADGSGDAIFAKDRSGRYLLFNEAAARLVGRPVADVLGRNDTALFDPVGARLVMERDRRVMAAGRPETEEEELTAAGVTRVYLATKAPYRDEAGAVVGVIGISRDVTDAKRAQEALRAQEAFARGVLDSMTAHVAVLDPAGTITAVNGVWRAFAAANPGPSGVSPRTGVGTNYLAVCDAGGAGSPEAAAAGAGIRRVLAGGAERFALDYPCHTPGERRWFHLSATRLDHAAGGVVVAHTNVTDRYLAAEAVRASEQRFRDLADAIPQIVWIAGPDGGLTHLNAKAAEYTGQPADTLTGWAWGRVIHPDDLPGAVAEWTEVLRTGTPRLIEFRIRQADGEYRWHITRQVPVRDAAGAVAVWYGTTTDVEDLMRAADTVRQSEERLRLALRGAGGGAWEWDLATGAAWWSPEMYDLWGVPPGSPIGMTASLAAVHPDDRDRVRATVEAAAAAGADYRCEFRVRHPARGERWVASSGRVLDAEPCRPGRLAGTSQDVTDRRRAEEARRESESRFRGAFEDTNVAMVLTDLDNRFTRANEAFARFFGYTRGEVLALAMADVTHPDDLAESHAQRAALLAEGASHFVMEKRYRHRDGHTLWGLTNVSLVRDAGGRPHHYVGQIQDITERKRVELTLRAGEERYRLLFEANPHPMWVYDRETLAFLAVNDAAVARYGYARDEFLALTIRDIRPPEDVPALLANVAATTEGYGGGGVWRHRPKDGRLIRVRVTSHTLTFAGRPAEVVLAQDVTDQLRAEETLRASEERFRKVFEHAATGIVIADRDGRFRECNPAYRAILGYSTAELRGADLAALVHPADRAANRAGIRLLLAGEAPAFEVENRYVRKDGEPVWVHKFVSVLPGAGGDPLSLIALVTDVTERRRAEAALRASEERYRTLVDVLPGAVFVVAAGRIVFCNPAFVRLMGAGSADDLLGTDPLRVAHPDYRDLVRGRIEAVSAGRPVGGVESRVVRLDGRPVPVYSVAAPVSGAGPNAFLVALSDLTERERSMDLLRTVLGSVNDAILTIDARGTIGSANPAAERSFGYPAAELIGANVRVLMPEPYRDEHDQYLANYLRTGVAKVIGIGREVEGRRKDGSTFPAELTVTEFLLDGERHFTGVVRDTTARKRLEDQFRQSQKMDAVGRLAGGVAHDFNNLLTVINGYSDLLLMDQPAGDPGREPLAAIRDAGERAARLTQQLLAFSRKAIVEPKTLDLNALVEDSARLLRRLIGEDVVLLVRPDPALPPVHADPGQLEQVLMNLVVNARDAMPTGGRLRVETRAVAHAPDDPARPPGRRPGWYAELCVSDTGHGMTDEVKGKVFEPFFTTKGVGKGTGLGLAVVHGVVEQSGGHIAVESAVGAGTTFRLLFPAAEAADARTGPGASGVTRRGTETVLLVEDEAAVRRIARLALEGQGYAVLDAGGGAEAIALAAGHPDPIHALVTDVVMPGMNGRQLAEALRAARPGLRVLYMSGYTDDAVVRHGVFEAADAFLQKPFTPLGLARKVREVLDAAP